jgi:hypothetical protein
MAAFLAAPTATTAAPPHHIKLPADYAAWTRVANCESGGWRVLGPVYPDALGITRANLEQFRGQPQRVGPLGLADRISEIRAADRLIKHYAIAIPDQDGRCRSW